MRHRTWSFNEVSGRYKELPAEYYVPKLEQIGVQSSKNHQSRDIISSNPDAALIRDVMTYQSNVAFGEYQYLLERGCPREVARMILPLNTYTELVATVKLRNLLEFFELRSSPDAQYEIQVYSDAMKDLIKPIVPVTISKWKELQK
jgi:thymidylate synthase (FAD)